MDTNKDQIYALIYRHLVGNITSEESVILQNWISQNKINKIEFDDIAALWEKTGQFRFPKKIDTNKVLRTVHTRAGINERKKLLYTVSRIAAILFLSIILAGLYEFFLVNNNKNINNPPYYQEVKAAYGTQTKLNLPDGTLVCLNSGSSLRFSVQFDKEEQRNVELKGEGYFEVTKKAHQPFIVNTGELNIEVLGTKFNVNAYKNNTNIEVALIEGKVSINQTDSKTSKKSIVLKPMEVALFNSINKKLDKETTVNLEKYIAWIDGKIIFADDPIDKVVNKLENWYNVTIQINDKQLLKYRFTGTFINEPIEEVLNVFCKTSPMQYEIYPAEKDSSGKLKKRTIILKIKSSKL